MALFEVNMPPIPDNIPIHTIEHTPLLKRAKLLWIGALILAVINVYIVVSSMNMLTGEIPAMSNTLSTIIGFCGTICILFCFFYLCKLARRKRLLKLYAIQLVIGIIAGIFQLFIPEFNNSSTSTDIIAITSSFSAYMIFCSIAAPIVVYILWELGKELSFITNEKTFFKATKIMVVGLLVFLISSVGFLVTARLQNENVALFFGILVMGFGVMVVYGIILYLIGIFKIRVIVQYGEDAQNTISQKEN